MSTPHILGVVNVTPDSFSDGGRFESHTAAIEHAIQLVDEGATIIDVGGESTRPGATVVDGDEERARVLPVVRELASQGIAVSVDTVNARTAAEAIVAGAQIVNDVSGGLADDQMARVVADAEVHYIAMHWRGGAGVEARYSDVVSEVRDELLARVDELTAAGIESERIILDPGLGFAKDPEHNWRLLARLDEFTALGHGVLIGPSRKRFIGALLPPEASILERDLPTAVLCTLAAQAGVWAVRVHDVRSTRRALDVWTMLQAAWEPA